MPTLCSPVARQLSISTMGVRNVWPTSIEHSECIWRDQYTHTHIYTHTEKNPQNVSVYIYRTTLLGVDNYEKEQ